MNHAIALRCQIERILAHEPRYARDAYLFCLKFIECFAAPVNNANSGNQSLVEFFGLLAKHSFGPMAMTTLRQWGILAGQDVFRVISLLAESKLVSADLLPVIERVRWPKDLEAWLTTDPPRDMHSTHSRTV